MIYRSRCLALHWAVFFATCTGNLLWQECQAAEESFGAKTTGEKVMPASREGEQAIKKFVVAPGLQATLWAAEPLVANIVSFNFDDRGQCYVVETFRHSEGVTDIRSHMDWLDEELASTSVEDRIAIMRKHEGARITNYARMTDRVRKVWDSKQQGYADQASIFSDDYRGIEEGLASGVLAWRGSVYFANIPNLWKLQDRDGDGVAEEKKSILQGFGVRVGFLGHDLHGLTVGPDGKLYFSIGDRGANVVTPDGRKVSNPEMGAVYRCNWDGTGLEIFASGLRNPEELTFDDYGNWFTGDNNSDGGDPARWVYLVPGGDSGWRIGYQFIDQPNSRGPWIAEKMCYPQGEEQPTYILPPIATIASGPSGVAYYPGTGLPDRYKNHFFLVDFTGGKGSGVHSFALKPKGAGFTLVDRDHLISEVLATDVEFGPDGGVYVSDWVQGWDKTGKGRIYRLFDPNKVDDPIRKEVQTLLASDWGQMSKDRLTALLSHVDQRIRLRAQFALADQGEPALPFLTRALQSETSQLARIHAIWGLGQILDRTQTSSIRETIAATFQRGLKDSDTEIRAQCAKALGEARVAAAAGELSQIAQQDESVRTRFLATMALAQLKVAGSAPVFLQVARNNATDKDPYVRHAAVMGLAGLADESGLSETRKDPSPEVRRVALLALRRLASPRVADYLQDSESDLVTEAARAISDLPITPALQALSHLSTEKIRSTAMWRRVVNAHFRLGTEADATALMAIAQDARAPEAIRAEALQGLSQWAQPSGRDRVTGLWRPLEKRDATPVIASLSARLPEILRNSPGSIQIQAANLISKWKDKASAEALVALISDSKADPKARRESLKAIVSLRDTRVPEVLELASKDADAELRREATRLRGEVGGASAFDTLTQTLSKGSVTDQQAALASLAGLQDSRVDNILSPWMDQLLNGSLNPALRLDVLEAIGKRKDASLLERLKQYTSNRKKDDTIAAYRECLEGGNAEAGRKIFFERADVACVRCHKVKGEGGEVGPELTGVGTRNPREYILESIVSPNSKIAVGFETVLVNLKDGSAYAGQLKKETDTELVINSPEDGLVTVKKSNIASRERGLSGMPEELRQMLSKQDLRNLVEFLYTTK